MIIGAVTLNQEYTDKVDTIYKPLLEEANFIIKDRLKDQQIKVHAVFSRIKEYDSFSKKAKDKKTKSPFEEISDIVGIRIVCLFLSDITRIGEMLKNNFELVSEDNKIDGYSIDSFGYMSFHYILKMKTEFTGPRYEKITNVPFEVQVRTVSMDAWANISHYLDYKSESDIPSHLLRDFHAISGLFYVADKHFELFFEGSKKSKEDADKDFHKVATGDKHSTKQEINLDTLTAYLKYRFPTRNHCEPSDISNLIEELNYYGYETIDQIEEKMRIEGVWHALEKLEEIIYPDGGGGFWDVGVTRAILDLTDDDYANRQAYFDIPKDIRDLIKK